MTGRTSAGPLLVAEARPAGGAVAARLRVGHGEDPVALLRSAGWRAGNVVEISGTREPHEILVAFESRPAAPGPVPTASIAGVRRDPDLSDADVAAAVEHQRIAAYAVVTSARGVLLTELSDRTNAPGTWTLPGGGIDPAETPEDCVRRELWEETGQRIGTLHPLGVLSRHWIGRAPHGRIEDYHVVGLVYRARCERPGEPVVHDTGGTTESAAWVPVSELGSRSLTQVCHWALRRAGVNVNRPAST